MCGDGAGNRAIRAAESTEGGSIIWDIASYRENSLSHRYRTYVLYKTTEGGLIIT